MPNRDSGSDETRIGHALEQARKAAKLDLNDVAAQLRIRREFLAALEEGRVDALPGITYAIGYVRTYAAFLGLDPEPAVRRFKQEAAGLDRRTELVFPSPAPEGRVPGAGLMVVSVLLAGMAYGGWYWMSERGMSVYDMVPEVPERLVTLIEGEGSTPLPPRAPAPSSSDIASRPVDGGYRAANPTSAPVAARPAEQPAAVEAATAEAQTAEAETAEATTTSADAPAEPTAVAASTPMQTTDSASNAPVTEETAPVSPSPIEAATSGTQPTGQAEATRTSSSSAPVAVPNAPRLSGFIGASEASVPDASSGSSAPAPIERIVVRATGESWVQIRTGDGTTLFTRVLRNGDVYRVPDRSGLTLATGNAGALEVVVDGTPAPSLGTFGEVVRNIVLDPARLATGTAIGGRN